MGFPDLQPILQSLLDSGRYSDLTIACGGQKFQVHRAIVCPQSSFFEAAVKGGFKEAIHSHIDLPDDDLATIQRVVSFLYRQDYEDTDGSQIQDQKCPSGNNMEPHAVMWNNFAVFIAADKFDMPPLKALARSRIISWVDKWAKESPLVVQEIWKTIPPHETQLQEAIIKVLSRDAQSFLAHDESMVVMTDIPEITIAVLRKVVEGNSSLKPQRSGGAKEIWTTILK